MAEALTIRWTDRCTLPGDRSLPATESVEYLQADRRRREHRGSFGYQFRPNGRTMFRPTPRTALITRCNLKQTFHLNIDDRQYTAGPLHSFPNREEILVRAAAPGQLAVAPHREPTILVETGTVDTG